MTDIKAHIFERPELEYPVYVVTIDGQDKYIQRIEEMNSGYSWYEVCKDRGAWRLCETSPYHDPAFLGFNKAEAIAALIRKYSLTPKYNKMKHSIEDTTITGLHLLTAQTAIEKIMAEIKLAQNKMQLLLEQHNISVPADLPADALVAWGNQYNHVLNLHNCLLQIDTALKAATDYMYHNNL